MGHFVIFMIFLVISLVLLGVTGWKTGGDDGYEGTELSTQAARGKYYVLYPDGERSQRMSLETAMDYASIFNGTVKRHVK